MEEDDNGGGRFVQVILRPRISLRAGGDVKLAARLHHDAHEKCFIANSVNFSHSLQAGVRQRPPWRGNAVDLSRIP